MRQMTFILAVLAVLVVLTAEDNGPGIDTAKVPLGATPTATDAGATTSVGPSRDPEAEAGAESADVRGLGLTLRPPLPGVAPLAILFCLIAICVLYYSRFAVWPSKSDPKFASRSTRFYTTRYRYNLFAVLYALLIVGVFLVILYNPSLFLAFLERVPGLDGSAAQGPQPLESPPDRLTTDATTLLAFFLSLATVFFPGTMVEDRLRSQFQNWAGIPNEATTMARRLLGAFQGRVPSSDPEFDPLRRERVRFQPRSQLVAQALRLREAKGVLHRRHFEPSHVNTIGGVLAHVGYLLAALENERGDRAYGAALDELAADMEDVDTGYRTLLGYGRVQASKAQPDDHAAADAEPASDDAAPDPDAPKPADPLVPAETGETDQPEMVERAEGLLEQACRLLVYAVFLARGSNAERRRDLLRMGFELPERVRPEIPKNLFVVAFLGFMVGLVIPTLFYFSYPAIFPTPDAASAASGTKLNIFLPQQLDPAGVFSWSFWGGLMHLIGVVAGVLFVRFLEWQYTEGGPRGASPSFDVSEHYFDILLAGVLAAAVNVLLFWALDQTTPQTVVRDSWYWALPPFVTGGMVAFACSRMLTAPPVRTWWPWIGLQAALTGLATTAVAAVVITEIAATTYPPAETIPFIAYCGISGLLLGCVAAFTVIWWYDMRLRPAEAASKAAETLSTT